MAELAAAIPTHRAPPPARLSISPRSPPGARLVALADWLFFFAKEAGATSGRLRPRPARRRCSCRRSCSANRGPAAGRRPRAACCSSLALAEDPSWLALALFWLCVSLAVLLPRAGPLRRCLALGDAPRRPCLPQPARPARRRAAAVGRAAAARRRLASAPRCPSLWLPILGSALFLAPVRDRQPADRECLRPARSGGLDRVHLLRPDRLLAAGSPPCSGRSSARALPCSRRRRPAIPTGCFPASASARSPSRCSPSTRSSRCRTASTSPSCGAARRCPRG